MSNSDIPEIDKENVADPIEPFVPRDDVVPGEVIETRTHTLEEPEVPPHEAAAIEAEQRNLDHAMLTAQVEYLTGRVAELARENARLKAESA